MVWKKKRNDLNSIGIMNHKWKGFVEQESVEVELKSIHKKLDEYYKHQKIVPPREVVFRIFDDLAPHEIRALIIGQDPYINLGEADGYSFSVPVGMKIPPSLQRIGKVLSINFATRKQGGCLESWVDQGVFLVNASLTTLQGQSKTHTLLWNKFFVEFMKWMAIHTEHIVYFLWGNDAKSYQHLINKDNNLVLTSRHPSPLAGNGFEREAKFHFQDANAYLLKHNKDPIDWV